MHPMRSTVAMLATLVLALVALSPGAIAQEDGAEHPLVGAWVLDTTPDDPSDAVDLFVVNPGGTVLSLSGQGPAAGSWEPTGDRTADVTFRGLTFTPDGGFGGLVTIRASGEVAEDGQTFTATYTIEPPAAMAQMVGLPEGQLGPSEVFAQRISVDRWGGRSGRPPTSARCNRVTRPPHPWRPRHRRPGSRRLRQHHGPSLEGRASSHCRRDGRWQHGELGLRGDRGRPGRGRLRASVAVRRWQRYPAVHQWLHRLTPPHGRQGVSVTWPSSAVWMVMRSAASSSAAMASISERSAVSVIVGMLVAGRCQHVPVPGRIPAPISLAGARCHASRGDLSRAWLIVDIEQGLPATVSVARPSDRGRRTSRCPGWSRRRSIRSGGTPSSAPASGRCVRALGQGGSELPDVVRLRTAGGLLPLRPDGVDRRPDRDSPDRVSRRDI